MASIIDASTAGVGGIITTADNTGNLNIQSGGSTKIAVTSAGANIVGTLTVNGAAPAYGKVLQVVGATTTTKTTTTSTSYVTTALTASITPTSATSKIIVFISASAYLASSGGLIELTVYRNGSNVTGNQLARVYGVSTALLMQVPIIWYDSPATTSSTTYTLYIANNGAGSSVINQDGFPSTITLMEIAA